MPAGNYSNKQIGMSGECGVSLLRQAIGKDKAPRRANSSNTQAEIGVVEACAPAIGAVVTVCDVEMASFLTFSPKEN